MQCHIIGIDCATDPNKRGAAIAEYDKGNCVVRTVETGLSDAQIAEYVENCLNRNDRALIALDAPLGWPELLGKSLAIHRAGCALEGLPNTLFRRETDRFIKERLGKQPLDVGADRIARTAYSALRLLSNISKALGDPIHLAWRADFPRVAAIEVYPAATLRAYGFPDIAYKKSSDKQARQTLIDGIGDLADFRLAASLDLALSNADALDAIICALAGRDFLKETVYQPVDEALAHKEGWIWVKPVV